MAYFILYLKCFLICDYKHRLNKIFYLICNREIIYLPYFHHSSSNDESKRRLFIALFMQNKLTPPYRVCYFFFAVFALAGAFLAVAVVALASAFFTGAFFTFVVFLLASSFNARIRDDNENKRINPPAWLWS